MPPPNAIVTLPQHIREWLDQALLKQGFSGYQALAEYLQTQGYSLGKSTLHRYGQKLERRLASIRASTEAARMLAANVDDTENHLSGSVISLVQSELFETLLNLQEAADETDAAERVELLSKAARSIAEVSRASIANKKWQTEVLAKAEAAASRIEVIARKGGLSTEAAEAIRREILGIAN
ncbi:MAG: DUF3486 family protein [Thiothrix sp.]|nr:DUF3486 family protein [Thiothrix sp.]HPQ94957.1 DUF3486 family protein [Thiolinea sp.]